MDIESEGESAACVDRIIAMAAHAAVAAAKLPTRIFLHIAEVRRMEAMTLSARRESLKCLMRANSASINFSRAASAAFSPLIAESVASKNVSDRRMGCFFKSLLMIISSFMRGPSFYRSVGVPESVFQCVSGAVYPCFYSGYRGVHNGCYVFVAQFLLLEQENGGALLFRQAF